MGVIVTARSGCDLGCAWKIQGHFAAGSPPGGYYIDAAQGGEPPEAGSHGAAAAETGTRGSAGSAPASRVRRHDLSFSKSISHAT